MSRYSNDPLYRAPTGELRIIIHWSKERFPKNCFYCGVEMVFKDELEKYPDKQVRTKDHVFARIQGGGNSKHNIVFACSPCNGEKSWRNIDDYRQMKVPGGRFWAENEYREWKKRNPKRIPKKSLTS